MNDSAKKTLWRWSRGTLFTLTMAAPAWSMVHGYASLTLERELEGLAREPGSKKLLRKSLHLMLDQFST